MKFHFPLKNSITVLSCFLLFSEISIGQSYNFRNYSSEYGLPNSFVYTISQSTNGFLWVGTGAGIVKFDGYEYFKIPWPDSLGNRNPSVSFRDSTGTLWFGCSDGTVFYTGGADLQKLNISNTRSIIQILQGPDGLVYIIPQGNSIFSVNPNDPEDVHKYMISEEYNLFSACFSEEGLLMLGTQGSVLLCNINDTVQVRNSIEEFEYSGITGINSTGRNGEYIIGTENYGLFRLRLNDTRFSVDRFSDHSEWSALNVKSIFIDKENKIWVSTNGSGVIQFTLSDNGEVNTMNLYDSSTGLVSDDVRLVFQDMEGNYWFGLFGEGVSMLASYAFSYHTPGKNSSTNNIIFTGGYNENYILGTPSGFHIFDVASGRSISFTELSGRVGGVRILSYYLDELQKLWIGTDGMGLYVMSPDGPVRPFYRSGDSGADKISDIRMDKSNIWLATTNGVMVLDRQRATLKGLFNTNHGLPRSNINTIILDNGNAYIGTETDRLYMIDKEFNVTTPGCVMTGSTKNKIFGFSRRKDGSIWTATYGNGIFACFDDSVASITHLNGLFSNYCYSILTDNKNNVWVGHSKGFSKLESGTSIIKTFGTDYANGGTCNPGAMYESADGKIFIGTTEGVIVYDSRKDNQEEIPPFSNITSIIINDDEYRYQPVISLPYKKYRITINYSGINFSDPEKVFYQTYLENFDLDWSNPSPDRESSYQLGDGRYKFNLVTLDENGLPREPVVTFSIIIAKPVYKKWWFVLLCVSLLTGIILFIFWKRDQAQRKVQKILEEELERRTSVIRKQKAEIEQQNVEITDSINYAKRIQSSVLPDINKLKENFMDAFIMFYPRDIVSGDFYWFDKIDDEKFIIVCADSTGHGVPGAFMSMIGATLLQDIVTRKKITRPSQILTLLDKQIFSTLNQNMDLGVSNDGMDLVICEVNLKTRHIRFASAMRPIIIVQGGEPLYVRGNRSSVGGEAAINKYFDDQEFYLNSGDTIYLFSDGFPDQFGGPDGKKMKIARLKSLIEQINNLPMLEQEVSISKFFDEWKGSFDQIDDVLLMGVRV